jgi:hypothetical protein
MGLTSEFVFLQYLHNFLDCSNDGSGRPVLKVGILNNPTTNLLVPLFAIFSKSKSKGGPSLYLANVMEENTILKEMTQYCVAHAVALTTKPSFCRLSQLGYRCQIMDTTTSGRTIWHAKIALIL